MPAPLGHPVLQTSPSTSNLVAGEGMAHLRNYVAEDMPEKGPNFFSSACFELLDIQCILLTVTFSFVLCVKIME